VEGPANPGSTAPSPDEGGGGGAPAQPLPAAEPASHHRHRRALLGQCRPSSSPWPPQPVQLRRQRPGAMLQILQIAVAVERPAVDTAGQATPVAGLRSARTGAVRRRPARAAAGLAEPRAGRDGDLPGPARLPAPHEASPPLGLLPGSDQPTRQAGTAKPERIAHSLHRGRLDLYVSCTARVGRARPTKHVVDSPLGPFSNAGGTQRARGVNEGRL
jgi:hypothetical protein